MRILIIAPFFYPYNNPRAHRWGVITRAWAEAGHEVHVLTSSGPKNASERSEPNIFVYRVGYNAPKEVISQYFGVTVGQDGVGERSFLGRLFYWAQTSILEKIYWPDSGFIWYFAARRAVRKLLTEYQFDGIVSVALPFTAHLVGISAYNKAPNIPWIADMGDPFSLQVNWKINNHTLYGRLNRYAESRVLTACTAMTVTNEATRKLYETNFADHAFKLKVIHPTLTEDIEKIYSKSPLSLDTNKIHIGFFGNFYKDIRSPEGLFELLREAQKLRPDLANQIKIHFAGDTHPSFLSLFEAYEDVMPMLTRYGLLPRADAMHLSTSMSQLLLIGFSTNYQLPSKTVDYLYAAKPVINVCYFTDEPFRALFGNHAPICHILLPFDHKVSNQNAQQFLDFVFEKHPKTPQIRNEVVAQFGSEAISNQYLSLLR